MPTPTYTIQRDAPWMPPPGRASTAPTVSSMYSEDFFDPSAHKNSHPPDVPSVKLKPSYHPSYHAHPSQEVHDYGPQVRQSRLPIFKQVRSMLHKPTPITTPGDPKWDEYTGELSANGKPSHVKPSSYTSPYDGAFKALRKRSPERSTKSKRNLSPVSVLRDEEIRSTDPSEPMPNMLQDTQWSPVSPVSPVSPIQTPVAEDYEDDDDMVPEIFIPEMMPEPLSPNIQRAPPPQPQRDHMHTPPNNLQIKRKPVSRVVSAVENLPPTPSPQHSPSQSSDMSERIIDDRDVQPQPHSPPQDTSHFSWTTYAPSVAPGRQSVETTPARKSIDTIPARKSIDATPPRQAKYSSGLLSMQEQQQPRSRFSWSTVATNHPNQAQAQAPPDSPPPPVPTKFSTPPMQSILSRRRPVQRIEREEWAPPPRESSRGSSQTATPKNSSTPTSAHPSRPLPIPKDNLLTTPRTRSPNPSTISSTKSPKSSSGKALPPPPALSPGNTLSHLESLLAQEKSILLQRLNVEKMIRDLEKIQNASPLEVTFGEVRDAGRKLREYRSRLAEVRLEEREVGVKIARARRREEGEQGGSGEGLWVRRVTG